MKKKIVIVASTILAIIILVGAFIYINTSQTKSEGMIHLYVTIYEDDKIKVVVNQEVPYYEDEMLIDVLKRHVDVTEGTGSNQGMIVGINGSLTPDLMVSYYKIIVNCEWTNSGAWTLSLNDGDSIRVTYSFGDDWSTGC